MSKHRHLIGSTVIVLVAAWVLSGFACEQPCTMIGCLDGVMIHVVDADGESVNEFEAEVEIDGERTSYSCPNGPGCLGEPGLHVLTTASVLQVRIESEVGAFEGEIRPAYTESFPNGEHCSPACVQASAAVTLTP